MKGLYNELQAGQTEFWNLLNSVHSLKQERWKRWPHLVTPTAPSSKVTVQMPHNGWSSAHKWTNSRWSDRILSKRNLVKCIRAFKQRAEVICLMINQNSTPHFKICPPEFHSLKLLIFRVYFMYFANVWKHFLWNFQTVHAQNFYQKTM